MALDSLIRKHRPGQPCLGLSAAQFCNEESIHEYFSYSTQALKQLAVADAAAAEVLGFRLLLENPALSESYVIRAAALSGKPGPLVEYLLLRQDFATDPGTRQLRDVDAALHGLTIATVVDRIGYPLLLADSYVSTLREFGVSDEDISAAREASEEILAAMAETRTQVFGDKRDSP